MKIPGYQFFHQFMIGASAIILGPADGLPRPNLRITIPPENATQAIAFDFSRISKDLTRAIDKIADSKQLDLKLTAERRSS